MDESTAWELAVAVAEASLGGLGKVRIKKGFLEVAVEENPAVACLGSQMSGWALEVGGKRALGSGPARILARKPKDVFERLNYSENSKKAVLCLESEVLPDEGVCRMVLEKTGAHELFVAAYRPDSVVGLVNVLARVVEMGVYRLNFLGYDARKIVSASGSASIPKLDENTMYSANDAIIYAGLVELKVLDWDDTLTSKCV